MAVVESSPSFLLLKVTSSLSSAASERRYQSSDTIGDLKGKLELITGATASMMKLQLFDDCDKLICELSDDNARLGESPARNGYRLHVINQDPTKSRGEFEDTSQVEKYEISEDDYAKRTDSVLAFKKRMKLGQFAERDPTAIAEAAARDEAEKMAAEAVPVGSRCEVALPGTVPKRGTVMFVGQTDFKPGYWVGIKYDEPLGKNDGSVQGKRYFECPPKYGAFVKPKSVNVGDFPEESYSDDEM